MAILPCWSGGPFCACARRWPSATSGCGSRRIWCARCGFVIPAHSDERPPWLLRLGLLLYDRLASRSSLPASVDGRCHPPSDRQCAEAAVRHRVRIFRLRGGRFAAGDRQCRRCRGAGRRDPHRRALRSRRPARHLAAGGDRSRPSSGDHGKGAGQRHRRLDRVGRGNRVAHAAAAARAVTRSARSSSGACSIPTTSMCSRTPTGG